MQEIFSRLFLVLFLCSPLPCLGQEELWLVFKPVKISNEVNLSPEFEKLYISTINKFIKENKKTAHSGVLSESLFPELEDNLDSLNKKYPVKKKERVGLVTSFFNTSNCIEISLYKYSFDKRIVKGVAKIYLDISILTETDKIREILISTLSQIEKRRDYSNFSVYQIRALLAVDYAKYYQEKKPVEKLQAFDNYKLISRGKNLSLAVQRIHLFLFTINRAHPFATVPANVTVRLIDSDISNIGELYSNFEQSYLLLKASDELNKFIQLRQQRTSQENEFILKNQHDSINKYYKILEHLIDTEFPTSKEVEEWDKYGSSIREEFILFSKLFNQIQKKCTFYEGAFFEPYSSYVNMPIINALNFLNEGCDVRQIYIRNLIDTKYESKFKALKELDSISKINLYYINLAFMNDIDLRSYRPDLNKSEIPSEEELNKFVSDKLEPYRRDPGGEFGIDYFLKIDKINKEIMIGFSVGSNFSKLTSQLSGYPLGEALFPNVENYYEGVYRCIEDIQSNFEVTLGKIGLVGASDVTPFKKHSQLLLETKKMKDETFELVKPDHRFIKISDLDLKNNSDHKNIGLGFKRAYYAKVYFMNKGITSTNFNPIQVYFYNQMKTDKLHRKCNIVVKFNYKKVT